MNLLARLIAIILLGAAAAAAYAQTYPARPVRVIIAFPPGSATDIIGRVIAAKVSEIWGQQAVADNRGGAGGSIASLLAAKAAPDGYTLLINSNAHTEKFKYDAKINYTPVAYKGSGEIFPDLLGGRVDTYFAPISAGLPYIQTGRLRPLAITSAKRSSQLPDVPTIAESGVPKFEFALWFGLWGPAAMPGATVAKIRKDFGAALAETAVREKLASLGNEIMLMTPAQFRRYIEEQIADTAQVFKAAGIKPQ